MVLIEPWTRCWAGPPRLAPSLEPSANFLVRCKPPGIYVGHCLLQDFEKVRGNARRVAHDRIPFSALSRRAKRSRPLGLDG